MNDYIDIGLNGPILAYSSLFFFIVYSRLFQPISVFPQSSILNPQSPISNFKCPIAVISTKFCDDGFCVDLGYFGHFRGTKIVGGGSQVDRLLLELDDWITGGQVSAGEGQGRLGESRRGSPGL